MSRRNSKAWHPRRVALSSASLAAFMLILPWAWREFSAPMMGWLRQNALLSSTLAAIASAVAVARRRVLKRAEFSRSWLAPLPVRAAAARWEALLIETAPAVAVATAFALVFVAGAVFGMPHAVFASLSGGVVLGAMVSYCLPVPKQSDLPPGSRYVPLKRRHRGPVAPSLAALGYWPVRQMFARAQPKMVARALVPILLVMPLGTSADTAMAVVGLSAVAGALALLIPAAISVSSRIRRWIAPLPVEQSAMRATFRLTFGVIAGAAAVAGWLLWVLGVSLRACAAIGICAAVFSCLLIMGGVHVWRSPGKSA